MFRVAHFRPWAEKPGTALPSLVAVPLHAGFFTNEIPLTNLLSVNTNKRGGIENA
jgi:hypothetical protein